LLGVRRRRKQCHGQNKPERFDKHSAPPAGSLWH
jgi:hypothetical protein